MRFASRLPRSRSARHSYKDGRRQSRSRLSQILYFSGLHWRLQRIVYLQCFPGTDYPLHQPVPDVYCPTCDPGGCGGLPPPDAPLLFSEEMMPFRQSHVDPSFFVYTFRPPVFLYVVQLRLLAGLCIPSAGYTECGYSPSESTAMTGIACSIWCLLLRARYQGSLH